MKTFRVYKHTIKGIEAVKVGFSWPALFFGLIWMLLKKLYVLAVAWFVGYWIIGIIEAVIDKSNDGGAQVLGSLIIVAGAFALWLVPGFKGNKWREDNLTKRGYEHVQTVQAENPDAAVALAVKAA
jgi:hypothetical protein